MGGQCFNYKDYQCFEEDVSMGGWGCNLRFIDGKGMSWMLGLMVWKHSLVVKKLQNIIVLIPNLKIYICDVSCNEGIRKTW